MAKVKISEFSSTPGNNTDIDGINLAEGCAPSGINDAIRELMAQLKDFQTGAQGDSFNGPVGTSTAAAGAFTTLAASGAVTLSGGTANGVAYLNGSKVLTTGSALTFDGSNLGLGVTPSAWGVKALQGPASFSIGNAGDSGINLLSNAYYGSNWTYVASAAASWYQQLSGAHKWYNAPSGTAGNAISFTQAMTLDASGNLFLGTSGGFSSAGITAQTINGTSGSRTEYWVGSTAVGKVYADTDFNVWTTGSSALRFHTNGTERARIDSSGYFIVNGTSNFAASKFTVVGTTDGIGVNISGTYLLNFGSNGSLVGTVTTNGTSTSYNTASDYRLKENIQPMTGALATVAQLNPVTYNWKADGSAGQGFIAHELQEVVPDCVTGEKDAVDADGKPVYQGIDTSFLVGVLTAAIKEQQAIIESLKSRLDAANL